METKASNNIAAPMQAQANTVHFLLVSTGSLLGTGPYLFSLGEPLSKKQTGFNTGINTKMPGSPTSCILRHPKARKTMKKTNVTMILTPGINPIVRLKTMSMDQHNNISHQYSDREVRPPNILFMFFQPPKVAPVQKRRAASPRVTMYCFDSAVFSLFILPVSLCPCFVSLRKDWACPRSVSPRSNRNEKRKPLFVSHARS